MGSFLNPDTTRVIAKRIILTGHPFKVHKKTATVRYMFFNRGNVSYYWRASSTSLTLVSFTRPFIYGLSNRRTCTVPYRPSTMIVPPCDCNPDVNCGFIFIRRRALLQAHSITHEIRTNGPYPRVPRNTRLLQGSFRWSYQPDGYSLHVAIQTRFSKVEHPLERRN